MTKKEKRITIYFIIMALIIIPISSLRLALKGPLFNLSLSKLGGMGYYKELVNWGTIVTSFFIVAMVYFINYHNLGNRKTKIMLLISCILIELTVIIPFMPDLLPGLASLHNTFAFLGVVLLLITMYIFIIGLSKINKKIFQQIMSIFTLIVIISSLILLFGGVSSFFEITMVILTSLMLYVLNTLLNKEKKKAIQENTKENDTE